METKDMIDKIEVGKTYVDKYETKRTVLFVGEINVLCKCKTKYGQKDEGAYSIKGFKEDHSELPKEKRKFWLWDYENKHGYWKRSEYFYDESFKDTTGRESLSIKNAKEKRKVESSLLEIE
jgi:hypothetical protein